MKQNELDLAAIITVVKSHMKWNFAVSNISLTDLEGVQDEGGWDRDCWDILEEQGAKILNTIHKLEDEKDIYVDLEEWNGTDSDVIRACREQEAKGGTNLLRTVFKYLYTERTVFIAPGYEMVFLYTHDEEHLTIISFHCRSDSLIGKQYGEGRVAWEEAKSKAR